MRAGRMQELCGLDKEIECGGANGYKSWEIFDKAGLFLSWLSPWSTEGDKVLKSTPLFSQLVMAGNLEHIKFFIWKAPTTSLKSEWIFYVFPIIILLKIQ